MVDCGMEQQRLVHILPSAVDTKTLRAGLNRGHVEGDNVEYLIRGLAMSPAGL